MWQFFIRTTLWFCVALTPCFGVEGQKPAQEIWLSGVDPYVRRAMKGEPSDYMDLFRDDAPWTLAASRTNVFKTSTQWILNGSPQELVLIFDGLRRRGIRLAMEALIITRENDACGKGIEGYSAPQTMRRAAERIKALGGRLDYIAFDEPLWFGHAYTGANACRSSPEEIARNVATNVRQVKEVFPEVRIGDIEPISRSRPAGWVEMILRWTETYQEALGSPLDFFHVDLSWQEDLDEELALLADGLGKRGIRLGIIYNGDEGDADDRTWTENAEARFEFVETRLKLMPDDVILQTWMLHPAKMMPENQPGSMTYLVNRYARKRSTLVLGSDTTGTLLGPAGEPIANAGISIVRAEDGHGGELVSRSASGQVPPQAVSAVIGLRMNYECGCSGSADVGIGTMRYADSGEGISIPLTRYPTAGAAQYHSAPGQPVSVTSRRFQVKAGQSYHLDIPLRATVGAGRAGYLALIFLGDDGKEIKRDRIHIRPGERTLETATTDRDGKFRFRSEGGSIAQPTYAVFPGNDVFRGTATSLP